jgi:hypothetical protein
MRAAALALALACACACASFGSSSSAAQAQHAARHAAPAEHVPAWLAERSLRSWRINGDTWHAIAVEAPPAASGAADGADGTTAAPGDRRPAPLGTGAPAVYFYNARSRATAWHLPRHAPRVSALWDSAWRPVGAPLLSLRALCLPESRLDWATVLAPCALFLAAKHAPRAAGALRACAAAARAALLRGGGAAPKAD